MIFSKLLTLLGWQIFLVTGKVEVMIRDTQEVPKTDDATRGDI
jgi:hypothetical protein